MLVRRPSVSPEVHDSHGSVLFYPATTVCTCYDEELRTAARWLECITATQYKGRFLFRLCKIGIDAHLVCEPFNMSRKARALIWSPRHTSTTCDQKRRKITCQSLRLNMTCPALSWKHGVCNALLFSSWSSLAHFPNARRELLPLYGLRRSKSIGSVVVALQRDLNECPPVVSRSATAVAGLRIAWLVFLVLQIDDGKSQMARVTIACART